jgi:hypothetical protein
MSSVNIKICTIQSDTFYSRYLHLRYDIGGFNLTFMCTLMIEILIQLSTLTPYVGFSNASFFLLFPFIFRSFQTDVYIHRFMLIAAPQRYVVLNGKNSLSLCCNTFILIHSKTVERMFHNVKPNIETNFHRTGGDECLNGAEMRNEK